MKQSRAYPIRLAFSGLLSVLFLAVLIAGTPSEAQSSIGVQFVGSGTALTATTSAGLSSVAQTNWNPVSGATFTNVALVDSAGTSTSAELNGAADGVYTGSVSSAPPAGNATLTSGTLDNGWAGTTCGVHCLTFSGIPYSYYDVYVYATNNTSGKSEIFYLNPTTGSAQSYSFTTENGGSAWTVATSTWNGTGTQPTLPGGNYVHFTGLMASGFRLVWGSSPNYSNLNGIQIVEVPPPAPMNLTAVGGPSQVSLSWTASSGASSYNIYRGTASGTEALMATGVTGTYVDNSVTNGTTYYYKVSAVDGAGAGSNSNEVSITPSVVGIGVQFVGSGTALASGTLAGLSSVAQTKWNPVSGASFTNVALVDSAGASTSAKLNGAADGVYTDSTSSAPPAGNATLTSGTLDNGWAGTTCGVHCLTFSGIPYANYDVYVYATNNTSGKSEIIDLTPTTGSAQSYSFTTENGGSAWNVATSTWNGTGTQPTLPSANYAHFTRLTASGFTLVWGSSPNYSNLNAIQIVEVPPLAPMNLTAAGGPSQVSLSWTASSGASSYNIYRGAASGTEALMATGVTGTTYVDNGLTNGTTYYYEVVAADGAGAGSNSNEVSITPSVVAIGVQFLGGGTALTSGSLAGLTSVAQTNWNPVPGDSFTNLGLVDAFGASTTATLSGSSNTMGAGSISSALPGGNATLTSGELDNAWSSTCGANCLTFSGIPYTQYDVYVYATNNRAAGASEIIDLTPTTGSAQSYSFTTENGGSAWTVATSTWNGTGTQPTLPTANYAHFTSLTASGFTLNWGSSTSTTTGLNAIQIVRSGGGSAPQLTAPTLTATARGAQINLSWTTSSGAASYIVSRGTASGAEIQVTTGVSTTTYTDNNVTNGATYFYELTAVSGSGTSSVSNEAAVTPILPAPIVSTPSVSNTTIGLSWKASAPDATYSIYRGSMSGQETPLTSGVIGTSYSDTSVTNETTYYYKVMAVNNGGESVLSNEVLAVPSQYTMTVQSPSSPSVVTGNQLALGALIGMAITDANAATTNTASYPIQVTAPGMTNVAVWTHSQVAAQLTQTGSGVFTGTLNLSAEPTGPLHVQFIATNAASSPTVELIGELTLYVTGSTTAFPTSFIPAGAAGMTLTWSDEFNSLNAGSCVAGTGSWPPSSTTCIAASASQGYTWYENLPKNSSDFGKAAYESDYDPAYNPFTIDNGFLRIRSTYDPSYVDPYGDGHIWRSGTLSTAFPDGSLGVPVTMANGYYEARILSPHSGAGSNTNASGGTWPAWWQLNTQGLQSGELGSAEIDTMEQYGEDPGYQQTTEHAYGNATNEGYIYRAHPGPDLTFDFHRYGMLVNNGTETLYLDDKPLASLPTTVVPGVSTLDWYLILDLAMGGDWPVNPSPAGYYDMWIDYVRYYQATGASYPSAPTDLVAAGGISKAVLSWPAAGGATSYNVYRSTTSGGETLLTTGVSGPSYTDSSVTNGTTYYYEVAAVNSTGTSAISTEVSAIPSTAPPQPTAPTNLGNTLGNAQVTLTWNVSSTAASYNIYRGTTSGGETLLTTGVPSPTFTGANHSYNITIASYTDTSVTNNVPYYYEVSAVNIAGVEGPKSSETKALPMSSDTGYSMSVQEPNSPTVITANQLTAGALIGMKIADSDAQTTNTATYPIQVTAPSMAYVKVVTYDQLTFKAIATSLKETTAGSGIFTGNLDLSAKPTGPLQVEFIAYNTPSGVSGYTAQLIGELTLFVQGTTSLYPTSQIPFGAIGKTLAWSDEFNNFNAGSCVSGTGSWPNCSYVSASQGYTWFEGLPVMSNFYGSDYGVASAESSSDTAYNPFTVSNGFLRIRSTYDANYVDPYGQNRKWYTGFLSSSFPDGSSGASVPLADGYYEARILAPNAVASTGNNVSASGGTWPQWWMADSQGLQSGSKGTVQLYTEEEYGVSASYYRAFEEALGDAPGPGRSIYAGHPGPDFTQAFHRYGILIDTPNNSATVYVDDVPKGSIGLDTVSGISSPLDWYLVVNLAMGGGGIRNPPPINPAPVNAPPAGYYDMWIDYVRYYH